MAAYAAVTKSALSSSTGPASRSIHSGVGEHGVGLEQDEARAPVAAGPTVNVARSAAPRPGTPWKGTATRSPAGASCSTTTSWHRGGLGEGAGGVGGAGVGDDQRGPGVGEPLGEAGGGRREDPVAASRRC